MKEKYFKPTIEIIEFTYGAILCTSILSDLFGDGGTESSAGNGSDDFSSWNSGDSQIGVADIGGSE